MNRMKRLCIVFCLLTLNISVCMADTAAQTMEDGLYTIGVQSSSRMFKITKCVLQVSDGQMTAVLTLSGDGYGYVYAGTAQEAADAPTEAWIPYVEDWDGAYTYALPISALDEEISVAGYSRRYEKWYDRTLVFHSSTATPYDAIAPDGVYTAIVSSSRDTLEGAEGLLSAKNGAMTLETSDGLSVELASLDKRVPLDETDWIMVRTETLEQYVVRAAEGVYQAEVTTDSSLLQFTDCMLKVSADQMTAIMTAKNNSFDYLYVGTTAEAARDEEGWIPAIPNADGAYTYVLEIPSLDNEIQVATYSCKKKMWYDRTICIDSASLKVEEGE